MDADRERRALLEHFFRGCRGWDAFPWYDTTISHAGVEYGLRVLNTAEYRKVRSVKHIAAKRRGAGFPAQAVKLSQLPRQERMKSSIR